MTTTLTHRPTSTPCLLITAEEYQDALQAVSHIVSGEMVHVKTADGLPAHFIDGALPAVYAWLPLSEFVDELTVSRVERIDKVEVALVFWSEDYKSHSEALSILGIEEDEIPEMLMSCHFAAIALSRQVVRHLSA